MFRDTQATLRHEELMRRLQERRRPNAIPGGHAYTGYDDRDVGPDCITDLNANDIANGTKPSAKDYNHIISCQRCFDILSIARSELVEGPDTD